MSTSRIVLLIIAAGTVIRLLLAGFTGLGYDESYMIGNARLFSLSYVDHAPLHVWITWAMEHIFASEAPIVVRLPFVLMFAGSTWLMYRLTARLFGERAGLWAVIAFSLAPVFSFSHASWVLPDGPAIFFLLAVANVVERILFDARPMRSPTAWWVAAGVLAGLAILSKYNAAFFMVAVLVYLLTVPAARRHLATPGPWLGAVAALVVTIPIIVWNLEHGLIGLFFQTRRVGTPSIHLNFLAEDIGGQALYLTPWLFVPFLISLINALRKTRRDPGGWLMALAAVGPIGLFTFFSLWAHGLPHWSMPGWLFTIPLFGRDAAELAARRPRFARGYMAAVVAVFFALLVAFAVQVTRGGLIPAAIVAENPALDPTVDLINWTELKTALAGRGMTGPGAVVASPIWMFAGKTSYALGPDVPVVCVCDDAQHFAFRYDQHQWAGRDMVVIAPRGIEWLWDVAGRYFDSFEPLPPVAITRNGETVITLDLRLGKNLHFPPK